MMDGIFYVQWYPMQRRLGLISKNGDFDEFKAQVDAVDKFRKSVIVPVSSKYKQYNYTENEMIDDFIKTSTRQDHRWEA
jgi:hypothetical protein